MSLVPQFGFMELMLIGVIALIIVGPKDLPKLMRSAGRFVAQARRMAGEFTAAFDQMAREAEMEDLRKELETLKRENPVAQAKREIDETLSPINSELRDEANEIRDAVTKPAAPAAHKPGGDKTTVHKTVADKNAPTEAGAKS